ncbi:MAG: exodeoxyribonuclease VII large subunit [Clostridia bacterium]
MKDNIYSVSQVNKYIKNMFEGDMLLRTICIKGEITNFKAHYTGHLYFTLKDASSSIKCVMFKYSAETVKFDISDGMSVVITGQISSYERDGVYQMYCKTMQPDGMGALYLAYEQLKEKLATEGLFDEIHKKPIPYLPKRVGIITSRTGAVIRDIINVSTRRYDKVNLLIYPSAVQGVDVASTVVKGIKTFNELNNVDVIIIARGGGSFEDLFGFNDEKIARAIFSSDIPVVSAVGHETDFTIADFVSDLRAPTPSAAAELVYPSRLEIQNKLATNKIRLIHSIQSFLNRKRQYIDNIKAKAIYKKPQEKVSYGYMLLQKYNNSMNYELEKKINAYKAQIQEKVASLDGLSPLKTLFRGYSIIENKEGKLIKKVSDANSGKEIKIIVSDGNFDAVIK